MKINIPLFVFTFSLFFCFSCQATAQQNTTNLLNKGQVQANFGLGFVPTFPMDGGRAIVPPLTLKVNCHLNKSFSLAATWGFSSTQSEIAATPKNQKYQWRNQFLFIGIGGSFHRKVHRAWEVYGGSLLGYCLSHVSLMEEEKTNLEKYLGIKPLTGKPTWSSFFGVRNFINRKMSLFGELGFGASLVNIGFSFRLK